MRRVLTPTPGLWVTEVFPAGFPDPSSVSTPSSFTSAPPTLLRLLSRLLHVYMNRETHRRGITHAVYLKHYYYFFYINVFIGGSRMLHFTGSEAVLQFHFTLNKKTPKKTLYKPPKREKRTLLNITETFCL